MPTELNDKHDICAHIAQKLTGFSCLSIPQAIEEAMNDSLVFKPGDWPSEDEVETWLEDNDIEPCESCGFYIYTRENDACPGCDHD